MIRFIRYDKGEPRVVSIPRWAIGLGAVAAVLVGIVFLTLAAGLLLVAVPVALVAGGVAAWIGRGRRVKEKERSAFRRAETGNPEIIDAEFRVIERRDEPPRSR
jgi:hypothetical protein